MTNALGELIEAEVERAEADLTAAKNRGQAILTASGALVTLLAGVLALAVGKDAELKLTRLTVGATIAALVAFVCATVIVLFMYLPSKVEAASADDLKTKASDEWEAGDWDKKVGEVLTIYLQSLRKANDSLVTLLRCAIAAEVIGIASVAVVVVSLLIRAT